MHGVCAVLSIGQFQINHLFNGSFATLCRQAGRKKIKFKLVNYSVYYPVWQDCACKTSKNLALILHRKCPFLHKSCFCLARLSYTCKILARSRKVDVMSIFLQDRNVHFLARSCKSLQLAGYVTSYLYFPIIQAPNY